MRVLSIIAVGSLAASCTSEPCRDLAPSVQLDVIVDDISRAQKIGALEVTLDVDGTSFRRMFPVEDTLIDGRTSIAVDFSPAPSGDFMLGVNVRAWAGPELLTETSNTFPASADACNRVGIDLTETQTGPLPDAGLPDVPLTDVGPRPDVGPNDVGVDMGVPDTGPPEICGDGLIVGSETCDDENDVDADGCTGCTIDPGFGCGGEPSLCEIWWQDQSGQAAYRFRQRVWVETSTAYPEKGYENYTLRVTGLDTARLIEAGQMASGCVDLRVVYVDPTVDVIAPSLPRRIIGCGTGSTEVHFMSPTDLMTESISDRFFIYYGGADAPDEDQVRPQNVYLWYDDASTDRGGRYTRGRVDDWFDGWDDSLSWNSSGYYTYNSPNDFASGYRRGVNERDVYVEAEFYHTGCADQNMSTGVILRGIIAGGSTGTETAWHYYFSGRNDQEGCGEGYVHDGTIRRGGWSTGSAVFWPYDGVNPARIISGQWRKHALAAWGGAETELRSWDSDDGWPSPGYPDPSQSVTYGVHTDPADRSGFIGIMTMQDSGRVRNVIARRFAHPEPQLTLGPEEAVQ